MARWFGIEKQCAAATDANADANANVRNWDPVLLDALLPRPGEIVLLTGASGAGKSSLLRALRQHEIGRSSRSWIDLDAMVLPDRPVVDCFGEDVSIERALERLGRVGLAEAWTYLRTPGELSEGQRWRLKVALGLSEAENLS